ncbi:MAG: potassium-transporting ATPase subunit KdpB, partial [Alphaproteobacteria bacterium]|nr:potassium-transporting ATPase subunit KdpB [Alphaproteobacteria bacterium]
MTEEAGFDGKRRREVAALTFAKLDPRTQLRNPVMFVVFVGAILTTVYFMLLGITHPAKPHEPRWFVLAISAWLWFTVLFANFAESVAEGRGKAQAASLKALRKEVMAKRLKNQHDMAHHQVVNASDLRKDDVVLVEAGDFIPCDGQVIEGIASVDESAITGESAPVIRESGGDSDAVTGGTRVLSDWIVVRISANPGETFLDKMVSLVEGAKRQKTPNEIALSILLAALTLIFLMAIMTLLPFSIFAVQRAGQGAPIGITVMIALLVCLVPTTIGGLLSAIGIAGMNRLLKANVIAMSGRAVEAAGDVNVLLLDKTGTITHGNRQAEEFMPTSGVSQERLAEAALLSSLSDHTPEGKSIVALARRRYGMDAARELPPEAEAILFSAETRLSGVRLGDRQLMKGAADAVAAYVAKLGGAMPEDVKTKVEEVARKGGTPLVVTDGAAVLGVLRLKDIVKAGIKERLADLRKMGIKSVMITGDNPLTAAAISAEAGVDDFLAQATPETKLKYIRKMQEGGEMVAMVGDGTNDAPALAQSNVAVCMNSGTQAAKEAANMIDLDSDPTKLIEIVEIGKQLLITRGALTTFSIANDVAKYFAIIPAAFATTYPSLMALDVMHLSSPLSAILAAVIFNALVIIALVPLALKGVRYMPMPAPALLRRNLLVYGLGGIMVPFAGIKAIDLLLG